MDARRAGVECLKCRLSQDSASASALNRGNHFSRLYSS